MLNLTFITVIYRSAAINKLIFFIHQYRFRVPSTQDLDTNLLLEFLGNEINSFFSNTDKPRDNPVLAVERLTVEGSGGEQRDE